MVSRLKALDERMESIKSKTATLLSKREAVALNAAFSVIENFHAIRQLMVDCQCDAFDPSWDEERILLESMLSIGHRDLDQSRDMIDVNAPISAQPSCQAHPPAPPEQLRPHPTSIRFETPLDDENTAPLPNPPLSPPSHPPPAAPPPDMDKSFSHSAKFHMIDIPEPPRITPEDFDNVPPHVRGRCSLADAERVLSKLRDGFEGHLQQLAGGGRAKRKGAKSGSRGVSSSGPRHGTASHQGSGRAMSEFSMTLQQLEAGGCRVSGQTGMCVLKTLERLGYVDLAKRGEVVSLTHDGCDDIIYTHSQQQQSNKSKK